MDYDTLRTQIRNYTEVDSNGLSDSTVSVIVQNAENRIYREVPIDAYRLYASTQTGAGTSTVSVPSGLRNIRYVQFINSSGVVNTLEQRDSSYLAEYTANPTSTSLYGEPKYYANWDDDTWFVAPVPNTTYTINIAYKKQPATITSTTSGTSYVSVYAADMLLYASLVESYKYLKGTPDMIQVYEQSYQQAVKSFIDEQLGLRKRDDFSDGEIRVPLKSVPPST